MNSEAVAIIGANMAGSRVAVTLRAEGYCGKIYLIGEEPDYPYERPPLSKEVLWDAGNEVHDIFIHDKEFYAEKDIELFLGTRAESLDLDANSLKLSSGLELKFSHLVFCTGARVRKLDIEGNDLEGVHYLRTISDAQSLAPALKKNAKIGIIGMGVIGAEVAASARQKGCEVTCIEPQNIPMARALGDKYGKWLAQVHREEGVDVRLGVGIEKIVGKNGKLVGVHLTDGNILDLDAVVVGIGVIPNVSLAQQAGLRIENGIVVDEYARTSAPNIYAAGDVTNMPLFSGGNGRVETYQNAQDQAMVVAQNIMQKKSSYNNPPWFWSDQYDINLQVCGDVTTSTDIIVRGHEKDRNFSAFYLVENIVVGVVTVNRARDMGVGKRLVAKRITVSPEMLSDETVNLRKLLH